MYHFILIFFLQIWYIHLDLSDYPYEKRHLRQCIMKSVQNISRKLRITEHLHKKHYIFGWRYKHFRYILINRKLKLMTSFSSNYQIVTTGPMLAKVPGPFLSFSSSSEYCLLLEVSQAEVFQNVCLSCQGSIFLWYIHLVLLPHR